MEEIKQDKRQRTYPHGNLYLASKNRVTLAGASLIAVGALAQRFEALGVREVGAIALFFGLLLAFGTDCGAGTIKTYKRTIDLYRKNGRIPSKRRAMICEGAYCYEVGYQEAIMDIKAGRVD